MANRPPADPDSSVSEGSSKRDQIIAFHKACNEGEYEGALAIATTLGSDHAIGLCLAKLGRANEAIEAYKKGIRRDEELGRENPAYFTSHYEVATLYEEAGRPADALGHLRVIQEKGYGEFDPSFIDQWIARLEGQPVQQPESVAVVAPATPILPLNAFEVAAQAVVAKRLGGKATDIAGDARKELVQRLSADHTPDKDVLVQKFNEAFNAEQYNEALAFAQQIQAAFPEDDFYSEIGVCQKELGNHEEAIAAFEEYLRRNPNRSEDIATTYHELARLYQAQRDLPTALAYLRRLKEEYPHFNSAYINSLIEGLSFEVAHAFPSGIQAPASFPPLNESGRTAEKKLLPENALNTDALAELAALRGARARDRDRDHRELSWIAPATADAQPNTSDRHGMISSLDIELPRESLSDLPLDVAVRMAYAAMRRGITGFFSGKKKAK